MKASGYWEFLPKFSTWLSIVLPLIIFKTVQKFKYEKHKNNLKGKVVLLTGASQGLGEALAHVFYRQGCKLILAARNADNLFRVKKDLLNLKLSTETFEPAILVLDLGNLSEITTKAKDAIEAFGSVDILINNGGISFRGNIVDTDIDVHIKVMMVNYFGSITLARAVLDHMSAKGSGHIVGISSVQGKLGLPNRSAYGASKHACQAYYDCLRAEVYDRNIKVTTVLPGYIRTSLSINSLNSDGSNYGVMDKTTESGMDPEDVAQKILDAVVREEKEVIIGPFSVKAALWLKWAFPSILYRIMAKRAKSS